MYNLVVGNAEHPVRPVSGPSAYRFMATWLKGMGLKNLKSVEVPAAGMVSEEVVLSNFFADLSVLDYYILRFHPSTVAAAIIFISRITLHYFAEQRLYMTSAGIVNTRSREMLGLVRRRRKLTAAASQ